MDAQKRSVEERVEEQYAFLLETVRTATALRLRRRLQPAGGAGDKVFPPTYEGGKYALETRVIDGERVPCVLLDSVQSQANRMELALLRAHREGKIRIPVISVDFGHAGVEGVGVITSLEAPHRIADAILRDSLYEGIKFRESPYGKILENASPANATQLFAICPTALLFGVWDSTGPLGGLGAKMQRAVVSEIFGVDIEVGTKTSSRIDPLQIQLNAGPLYVKQDGDWTLDASKATKKKDGKPLLLKKEGKPSEANHGNIKPTLEKNPGGVTMRYALQTVVLSLPMLRRLSFPIDDADCDKQNKVNSAARSVLAALGLCAALSVADDLDLRSRCLLVPEEAATWEVIRSDGTKDSFPCSAEGACQLTVHAVKQAKEAGLSWLDNGISLVPNGALVELVKKSRKLAMESGPEDGGE